MLKNGEIYKVFKMFEDIQPALPYTGGNINDKTPKEQWESRIYYNNGALNNQFIAFLMGYSFGKAVSI
jgi:viroplasmin and RNaseH domain-containing protein